MRVQKVSADMIAVACSELLKFDIGEVTPKESHLQHLLAALKDDDGMLAGVRALVSRSPIPGNKIVERLLELGILKSRQSQLENDGIDYSASGMFANQIYAEFFPAALVLIDCGTEEASRLEAEGRQQYFHMGGSANWRNLFDMVVTKFASRRNVFKNEYDMNYTVLVGLHFLTNCLNGTVTPEAFMGSSFRPDFFV